MEKLLPVFFLCLIIGTFSCNDDSYIEVKLESLEFAHKGSWYVEQTFINQKGVVKWRDIEPKEKKMLEIKSDTQTGILLLYPSNMPSSIAVGTAVKFSGEVWNDSLADLSNPILVLSRIEIKQ